VAVNLELSPPTDSIDRLRIVQADGRSLRAYPLKISDEQPVKLAIEPGRAL